MRFSFPSFFQDNVFCSVPPVDSLFLLELVVRTLAPLVVLPEVHKVHASLLHLQVH